MSSKVKEILIVGGFILAITIIILGLIFAPTIIQYNHKQTFEGEITDKYNKRSGDSDKFYIVLDDSTVLQNRDLLFKGRFNSADVQATLKVGDKVKVKTIGYRIHFFNMFPKIYEVEKR